MADQCDCQFLYRIAHSCISSAVMVHVEGWAMIDLKALIFFLYLAGTIQLPDNCILLF